MRSFDFYFTDNNAIIGKPEATLEESVNSAQIAVRSDLFLFLDYSDDVKVTTTGSPPVPPSRRPASWRSRSTRPGWAWAPIPGPGASPSTAA